MKLAPAAILAALLGPVALFGANQTLAIDRARSSVEVAVEATVDSFTARFYAFDADLSIPGGGIEGVSGQVHFPLASLRTDDTDRDEQMYQWLQTARFPNAELSLASLVRDNRGNYVAKGRLEFHGTARDVSFPLKIKLDDGILTVEGDATLDTRDYGLPIYRRFLIFSVNPVVHVRFRITGRLAPR
jgi:polyisoprenoid-binding protein YceI